MPDRGETAGHFGWLDAQHESPGPAGGRVTPKNWWDKCEQMDGKTGCKAHGTSADCPLTVAARKTIALAIYQGVSGIFV